MLEAARKRLSTAKTQATAASTNLESIKQMLVNAQSMSDAADKEVKDAQTALDEAEKKFEVIDVDGDDDPDPTEGSNKRRKVSLSPQSQSNKSNNNSSTTNNTAAASNNNSTQVLVTGSSSVPNSSNNARAEAAAQDPNPNIATVQIMESLLSRSAAGNSNTTATTTPSNLAAESRTSSNNMSSGGSTLTDSSNSAAAVSSVGNRTNARQGSSAQVAPQQQSQQQQPKQKHRLTPEARVALREAVLSAIRHPQGTIDTGCLQRAIAEGLPERAIIYTANIARQRDASNRNRSTLTSNSSATSTAANRNVLTTTSYPFSINQIVVEGCGHPWINGVYRKVQGFYLGHAPVYSKRGKWNGVEVNFGIFRVKSNRNYWYIGTFPSRSDDSTGIISTQDSPLSRLYKSNWNPDELRSTYTPPENGWVAETTNARTPHLPTCQPITDSDTTAAPNSVVEECGMPEVNGTYKLSQSTRFSSGLPVYWKQQQIDGKLVKIIVCSYFNQSSQMWDIGVLGENNSLYRSSKARQKGNRLDEAPLNDSTWSVNEGVPHPPPQVKRG